MARGTESKEIITRKILETFENSFKYDKEIRIPIVENGELIQVKCVLTCAKVNVENGGDTAVPVAGNAPAANSSDNLMITEQEKEDTMKLLQSLNL